ncbi:MAG: PAS domain S-box protein, partial [Euryarchaeota archaeon]|nr:PAS domain S-box protein [Euryarchaeota archaeon]
MGSDLTENDWNFGGNPLEDKFKLAFENAPIGMCLLDITGYYVIVNHSFSRMIGYSPEELTHKTYADITHPDDLPKNRKWFKDILEGKKDHYKLQKRYVHKNGAIIWAEVLARLIQDENAHPLYFDIHVTDISLIKELDELIRFQARALSQVHDVVVAVDNHNQVIYWNKCAEELYGVKFQDALGKDLNDVHEYQWIHPEDEIDSQKSLDTTGTWRGENKHRTRQGKEFIVESALSVLTNEKNQKIGILSVVRDITSRKMMERELKKSEKNYRSLVELARTGVIFMDITGKMEYINPHFAHLLGFKLKKLRGTSFFDLLDSSQEQKAINYLKNVKDGFRGSVELGFTPRNKTPTWALISFNTVNDAHEEHVGYIGIVMDINSRKGVERSLMEAVQERDEILQFYI